MTNLISTTVGDQHALIFQAWRCILGSERHAVYVSGPITTGPRFIMAHKAGTNQDRGGILRANIADIIESAGHLRKETGQMIIEPGSLTVPCWSQDDYLALWTNLIKQHIAEIRFLKGWDASIGCALEYEQAVRHGVDCRWLDGTPITHSDALALLTQRSASLVEYEDEKLVALGTRLALVADRLRTIKPRD